MEFITCTSLPFIVLVILSSIYSHSVHHLNSFWWPRSTSFVHVGPRTIALVIYVMYVCGSWKVFFGKTDSIWKVILQGTGQIQWQVSTCSLTSSNNRLFPWFFEQKVTKNSLAKMSYQITLQRLKAKKRKLKKKKKRRRR